MKSKVSPSSKKPSNNHRQHENNLKPYHSKGKREFYIQQHRLQIDDYMLGQIKRNKKSIKNIKNQIDQLRIQMDDLRNQNKKQRSEYDLLNLKIKELKKEKSSNRDETVKRDQVKDKKIYSNNHKTRRQFTADRESSETSIRSSVVHEFSRNKSSSNMKTAHSTFRKNNSCSKSVNQSRVLLKKKIQNLKQKAHVIKQSASQIQEEINKKIQRKMKESRRNEIKNEIEVEAVKQDYNQLIDLLKTNKTIKQHPCLQESIYQTRIKIPQEAKKSKNEISLNLVEDKSEHILSEKSILSTNREQPYLKNSAALSYYSTEQKESQKPTSSSQLPSQTNLLDSDKNIINKSNKKLKLSRCVNVQIAVEQHEDTFDQMLQRSEHKSVAELSFENQPSEGRLLKQLQFQFDQLVRQQLLSNDAKQKQTLSKTIRALLSRITTLKNEQSLH